MTSSNHLARRRGAAVPGLLPGQLSISRGRTLIVSSLALSLASVCGLLIGAVRADSCNLAIRVDCVSTNRSGSKVGFPPFAAGPDPVIYLKKVVTDTKTLAFHVTGNWFLGECTSTKDEDGQITTTDTGQYSGMEDPATATGPSLPWIYTGHAQYNDYFDAHYYDFSAGCNEGNDFSEPDCSADRTGQFTWDNPGCLSSFSISPPLTSETWTPAQHHRTESASWNWDGNYLTFHPYFNYADGTRQETHTFFEDLFLPYAVSTFVSENQAALNALPFPDWYDPPADCAAIRGGVSPLTVINPNCAVLNAVLSRMKYRIAVRGPRGERETIEWMERFTPAGGGTPVDTYFFEDITFNGEEQYLTATAGQSGKIVEPPVTAGRIEEGTASLDNGVTVEIGLGANLFGEPAGFLMVNQMDTTALSSPASLKSFFARGVRPVYSGGALRQVLAPQALADIVAVAGGYEIRFYSSWSGPTGGPYTPGGTPFTVWSFIRPDADANRLNVTKTPFGGTGVTYAFQYLPATSEWLLTSAGMRVESLRTFLTATERTETYSIRTLSGENVYVAERQFHRYPDSLGELRTYEILDPDFYAFSRDWQYYDNPATDGAKYGKLKQTQDLRTGYWEKFDYDSQGRLSKTVACFKSNPVTSPDNDNRVTEYSYTPHYSGDTGLLEPRTPRTITDRLQGQAIGYRTHALTATARLEWSYPNQPPSIAGRLVTTLWRGTPPDFDGVIETNKNVDNTYTISWIPYHRLGQSSVARVDTGTWNSTLRIVVDGTRTTTMSDAMGRVTSVVTERLVGGVPALTLSQETRTYSDPTGSTTINQDGVVTVTLDCCGTSSVTERDGTITTYQYDALKRLERTTRAGVTIRNSYDPAGNVIATYRSGLNAPEIQISSAEYTDAGVLRFSWDALGRQTAFGEEKTGPYRYLSTAHPQPDGGSDSELLYSDGTPYKRGNTTQRFRYEYGVELEAGVGRYFVQEIVLDAMGVDTAEWTKTYYDGLNRAYKTVYPDNSFSTIAYNTYGQVWKEVDPDGVVTLTTYNPLGEVRYHGIDYNRNGTLEIVSFDRFAETVRDVYDGRLRTRTYVWTEINDWASILAYTHETTPNGDIVRQFAYADAPTVITTSYLGSNTRRVTESRPDGSSTVTEYLSGRLSSVTRYAGLAIIAQTTYGYDGYGRLQGMTDLRTGSTTTYGYNNADELISVIVPSPLQALQTLYEYDSAGRAKKVIHPDGAATFTEYYPAGYVKKVYGARTYPVEYTYDPAGRLKTMKTWQNYPLESSAAITTWNYHPQRGWLLSKRDADNEGVDYAYSSGGRLQSRKWARHTSPATYTYNNAGDPLTVAYPDGTPNVTYTYDRRGQPITIDQTGQPSHGRTYTGSGELATESRNGITVLHGYDALRRRNLSRSQRAGSPTPFVHASYYFDQASRLNTVSGPNLGCSYGYYPYSSLLASISVSDGTAYRGISGWSYDNLNRLTHFQTDGFAPGQLGLYYGYIGYDLAGQRTVVRDTDVSSWVYQYDALGQVTYGAHEIEAPGFQPWVLPGQYFGYAYDSIGNRLTATTDAGTDGLGFWQASYGPNLLNQYAWRAVPGVVDVSPGYGKMAENQLPPTGIINGFLAPSEDFPFIGFRYFHEEFQFDNSSGPVRQSFTTTISDFRGSSSTSFEALMPQSPENFGYDLDGNQLQDGLWQYTWDAENRLIQIESLPQVPAAARRRLTFTYDPFGRRVTKRVWRLDTGQLVTDLKLAYDGWNLLGEFDSANNPIRTYTWGTDLSGDFQGAGGVRGLLAMTIHTGPWAGTYHYVYDGSGNVKALLRPSDLAEMARYEYGPFGERITAYGSLAFVNPFRFSTKYQDDETGLYYYGYRFYDPSTGGWLSRDPLVERGGPNLHGFVLNNPENIADTDGSQLWFFASPKIAHPVSQLEPVVRVGGEIGRTGFENFRVPPKYYQPNPQPKLQPVGPDLLPPEVVVPDPQFIPTQQPVPVTQPIAQPPQTPPPPTQNFHSEAYLYRAMIPDKASGGPLVGESARMLGVRPNADVEITAFGIVKPRKSNGKYQGMSVSPFKPNNLFFRFRPRQLIGPIPGQPDGPGQGKDPVWRIRRNALGGFLDFHQDSDTHGVIHSTICTKYENYKRHLEATKLFWELTDLTPFLLP